jgi:phosphatidylglycerophosphate synthase
MSRRPSLTVADMVSLSRLALAAAFVVAPGAVARLAVIVVAGITDYLDGWLARRHDQPSALGAVIDPAADRVFVVVVIAVLLAEGTLTAMQCLVLVARDIATTFGAIGARVVARLRAAPLVARLSGKVVTALQFTTLVAAVIDPDSVRWMLPLVAIASVISIADYAGALWRARVVALSIALMLVTPAVLAGQGVTRDATSPRLEGRLDLFTAKIDAAHAGIGLATDLGTYFRLATIVGAGVGRAGDETVPSGRIEVTGRFLLDPFRQARWGIYGGAGAMARYDDGPGTRGFLTLMIGAELPGRRQNVTAVEVGIGSGVRLGVAIRQGRARRR